MECGRGFTLLEFLLTLSLLAILITLAYPSYRSYLVRVHRIDGQLALLDTAAQLALQYTRSHHYDHLDLTQLRGSDHSPEGYYTLRFLVQTKHRYTLAAIPNGPQGQYDLLCHTFTINHRHEKGILQGTETAAHCWQ